MERLAHMQAQKNPENKTLPSYLVQTKRGRGEGGGGGQHK